MRLSLEFWDDTSGLDLNSSDFKAIALIGSGNGMSPATPNYIDLGTSDPIFSGKTLAGSFFTFHIQLKGTTDAALEVQRDTLNKWFIPNDSSIRRLVGYDTDNSSKKWYLEGSTISAPALVEGAVKNLYTVTVALKNPYWIEYDLNTTTWSITADTETQAITSVGNMPALPLFEITPVIAKASNDLKYKTFYAIHTSGYGATKFPVDITAGGLDTAALTTAKMRADGYDVGVSVNGAYVDRWFGGGGFDSATTTIWVNLNFSPTPTMLLSVALAGSGVPSTLTVTFDPDLGIPVAMSQNSTLQIGTELITYSSYTINTPNKTITFVPVARNAKGSSIASHSIGVSVYWIQNEVWLTYGNPAAVAPVINDDNKPPFDLATSSNTSWKYLTYGSSTSLAGYAPTIQWSSGGGQSSYTGDHGINADPYTDVGLKIQSIAGRASDARISWVFSHPATITNFAANGKKYRSGDNFPNNSRIGGRTGSSIVGTGGTTLYAIVSPTVVDTWEDITVSVAVAAGDNPVFFTLEGYIGSTLPLPYAMAELDDVTLTITDPPTCTPLGIEQANYKLSGSLENDTTGDTILFLDLVTKTGITLYIDCDTQEVYSADGKRVRGMIAFAGDKRDEWITLLSGVNSLIFVDVGTVEITIVVKWRGRNTI